MELIKAKIRVRTTAAAILTVSLLIVSCGRIPSNNVSTSLELSDAKTAIARLVKLHEAIEAIKSSAMVNDEARLQVLNQSVAETRDVVAARGLGNITTVNKLRKLVMYFIYSEQFFRFIRTDLNASMIDFVLRDTIATNTDSLRIDIGYDDDPLGKILADNLDIVKQRMIELLASAELPQPVRDGLTPLIARVGYVYGIALSLGDRPIPYNEGIKLCGEIDAVYPLLDQLLGSQQFFQASQDIRGTNEFLKDFLEINQRRPSPREDGVPSK